MDTYPTVNGNSDTKVDTSLSIMEFGAHVPIMRVDSSSTTKCNQHGYDYKQLL